MKTAADILREARALIDTPEKWCPKGPRDYATGGNQRCASVAIVDVIRQHGLNPEQGIGGLAWLYLRDTVGTLIGPWNDAPERTHAEVMAAFDRAIALAEQEEA